MAIDLKKLLGFMNSDDSENVIPNVHHKLAYDVRFRGIGDNLRVENVPGTTLIPNINLPSSGTNECIGAFYDTVRQRIFWFNYNSNSTHGIYIYNTQSQTAQTLLVNGSATDGDILGFTLTRCIVSVNIIYDSINGDIILFLDSLGRPTGLNVQRYLTTPYTITKRSFIDVAKAPPSMPPKCVYENDYTVSVNNLNNALFQFKERFVYDDFQKSVYSTGSEVPLPYQSQNPAITNVTSNNARIAIYVQTGDANIPTIEIWARQATDTTAIVNNNSQSTADYFLIASLNKAQLNIPNNSIYRYVFYNNGIYNEGSIEEETQLFDYVPQTANCQELLNGNTLIYAGITEGYGNTVANPTVTSSLVSLPTDNMNGLLFFAACNGQFSGGVGNQMTIYLTGVGTNDGNGNPQTTPWNNWTMFVNAQLLNGTSISFTYGAVGTTITTLLANLGAAAVTAGYTIVSSDSNSITLLYPSQFILASSNVRFNTPSISIVGQDAYFGYATKSSYDLAIQYYDSKGRTPGAQPFVGNPITTLEDLSGAAEGLVPKLSFNIAWRPPTWAATWQLLRSNSLTYSKRLGWVCNQTFTNLDQNTQQLYAYIGISNIPDYDKDIEAATPVVNYDFSQGDRIRFEERYPPGGAGSPLTTGLDYQITSLVNNPVINGVVQIGTFIQILYPTADTGSGGTGTPSGNFDFGGDNYQNYKVLIYGIEQNATANNITYFEFGKQYGIGNAGTSTAYHLADVQSQNPTLSQNAIVSTSSGDYFYRYRTVPAGNIYYPSLGTNPYVDEYNTFEMSFENLPITNSSFKIQNQTGQPFAVGSYSLPFFTNNLSVPQRLRLTIDPNNQMTVQVGANKVATISIGVTNLVPAPTTNEQTQYLVKSFYMGVGENVQTYLLSFDGYVNVPAAITGNNVAWLILYNQSYPNSVRSGGIVLKLEVINNIAIPIIESSFSDKYNIIINSNSRPSIYDRNAQQNYYPASFRWSLAYQYGTIINNTNRFYLENFDTLDLSRGDIQRMKARDRIIRFFQNRGCCEKGVYNSFVKDSQNQDILVVTSSILTINNVKYYEGEFGMGTNYTGLVSGKIQDYFPDVVRGYWMRLSNDGLIPVSELYKGQFLIRNLITPFNGNNFVRPDGGTANIFGYYDYLEEECHYVFQAGTYNGQTITGHNVSFNERRNSFTGFFQAIPEWIISAEEDTFSWLNGKLYIHNNTTNYTNYYGVQYYPSITLVFNDKAAVKKSFLSLGYQSNNFWQALNIGDVYTSQFNPQTGLQQISQLLTVDQEIQENVYYGAFKNDANSNLNPIMGLNEGDFLKGNWIVVKLTYTGSNFTWLYAPYIISSGSPRNF